MGVAGLHAWLDEHATHVNNLCTLKPGSTLMIDGCGLAYHLLHGLPGEARLSGYAAIGEATTSAVAAMHAAGASVVGEGCRTKMLTFIIALRGLLAVHLVSAGSLL